MSDGAFLTLILVVCLFLLGVGLCRLPAMLRDLDDMHDWEDEDV